MTEPSTATDAIRPAEDDAAPPADTDGLVESDLLVEDISIDGMCGVY